MEQNRIVQSSDGLKQEVAVEALTHLMQTSFFSKKKKFGLKDLFVALACGLGPKSKLTQQEKSKIWTGP